MFWVWENKVKVYFTLKGKDIFHVWNWDILPGNKAEFFAVAQVRF